jgi:phosphatidylglycerol lysyltransferase
MGVAAPPTERFQRRAAVVLRVAVLIIAGLVLRHQLAGLHRAQLTAAFRRYDVSQIAVALVCTAASFATLGLVELLALRYAESGAAHHIPRRAALATAFVAHAFSQSIGFGLLTGGAVRLRAYARYDVNAATVARASVFVSATTLLGLCSLGSIALLTTPGLSSLGWTRTGATWLGAAMAALVIAYFSWCALGRRAPSVSRWQITPPSPTIAALQMLLATADWLVAGMVLFSLLPHGTSTPFTVFLGAYLVAHAAGIASHVPAGAGVFEVAVLALLAPGAANLEHAGLIASLLAYRVLYYLLPLCAAAALATMSELGRGHGVLSSSHSASTFSADTSQPDRTSQPRRQ